MRRKKQHHYEKWVLICLAVFVVLGTGFCKWTDIRESHESGTEGHLKKAVKKLKLQDVRSARAEDNKEFSDSGADNIKGESGKADEKDQEQTPDRSDFEVQPTVPAGSDTQSDEKIVYLTIDDGPSKNTQTVLDILDRYHIKATFFVTHAEPDYQHMIKEAYDRGNTIGLHTYTHDYQSVYASADAYFQDLDAIGQAVKEQIGYIPCFIRFPGGSSNTISANYTPGIMTALSQEVLARGYQYYDWNVSSGDGADRPVDEILTLAKSGTQNNLVLLCHDSASKQTTMEALPAIIEHYQNAGYEFRPLDRQSFTAHHGISN